MQSRIGFFLLALSAFGSALPAQAPPSFGDVVEVQVVNVEVFVTDRNGQRVNGLKKEDFALYEDGKPVEITNFLAFEGQPVAAPGSAPQAPAAVPQAVASGPESWLNLVVLVDNLHLRPESRTRALEQIRKFLASAVRPDDRVMLATYDLGFTVRQPFTNDTAALDAALRQVETLPSFGVQADQARRGALRTMYAIHEINPCGYEIVTPVETYAEETRDEALRTVAAMKMLVNSLAGIPGRKAILHVSDGIPVTPGEELFQVIYEICGGGTATSGLPEGDSFGSASPGAGGAGYPGQQAITDAQKFSIADRFGDLAAHANANRVTLYTLQARGLEAPAAASADFDPGERALQFMTVSQVQRTNFQNSLHAMAADTGGRAMLDVNDFLPELGRMREDFASYYSLGYMPARAGDGRQHRIEVKVKPPGLRARHRRSYRDKTALERAFDRTWASLLYGFEDNPLEVTLTVGEQTLDPESKQWSVPIQLKIPLFKLTVVNQQETYRAKLRLLVATRDAKGGNSPVRQIEVPVEIPRKQVLTAMGRYYLYNLTLKMPSGEQQVAITVRDDLAAATSYLARRITVGNL